MVAGVDYPKIPEQSTKGNTQGSPLASLPVVPLQQCSAAHELSRAQQRYTYSSRQRYSRAHTGSVAILSPLHAPLSLLPWQRACALSDFSAALPICTPHTHTPGRAR